MKGCVIRRFGGAFTIWHSRLEDCSSFSHAWHPWLCLGGEDQGKPTYICLTDEVGATAWWLRNTVSVGVRTLGIGEVDRF